MAFFENAVTIIGNIGRDPELSYTNSGIAVLKVGIIRNDSKKNGDQWEDGPAQWFNVTVFGKDAEAYNESLVKGQRVVVVGELKYREWEKDGQKRNAVDIKAAEIAVSARWATVTATRRGSSSGSSYTPPVQPNTGNSAPQSQSSMSAFEGDEPPF